MYRQFLQVYVSVRVMHIGTKEFILHSESGLKIFWVSLEA